MLDASAALAALLNDGPARRMVAVEQLHAPHLVDSEVASGLRRGVAGGRLTVAQASDALRVWQQLGVTRYPGVGLLDRVWELRENVTAYDATYVALAELLDCALVTADARLSRAPALGCPLTVVPA
ncbi:type II toxin-antitoxin system VapC family toxin [Goekera deserti]|uniref:type II toxin-antitoxin system VapC family toxin n=1 Tax=Goekera deserti TaxID=2497753 RepID=UPI001F446022|nr:type II toxin-antitoxin system VapC family toxin [Goekera deserti]